jgi:hypothetical protein
VRERVAVRKWYGIVLQNCPARWSAVESVQKAFSNTESTSSVLEAARKSAINRTLRSAQRGLNSGRRGSEKGLRG